MVRVCGERRRQSADGHGDGVLTLRSLALASALWVLVPGVAAAQNEVGPTPPCGDVSNRLATTAFAQCAGGAIVLYATSFSGVTAGEQISACVAALPARGGICDARGVTSGATIPAITLANSGATVLGPCGLITVTGTIQIYNPSGVQGFRWLGCGGTVNNTGTSFTWAGNAIDPLFRIRGVRDSEFSYFGVNSSINAPLATAIRLETATGTTSTRRIFRDITINGTNSAVNGLTLGMQWCTGDNCGGAGGDANNDIDWVENATVINYFNTAFSIEGTQVKTIQFVNSQFSNGQRGVATNQGVIQAGSFRWKGGGGGSNTVADFDLGAPTDTIVIEGCNTEGSNRLLNIANATSSTFPITILGCRWAANNLNVDNFVVNYRDHGPLNLIGNSIEAPATSRTPKFQIDNGGGVSAGNAIGNSIAWQTSITVASQPFVCTPTPCWNTKGNILTNSSNVPQFMLYDYNAPGTLPTGNTGTCSTGVTVAGDARRGTWTSTAACALTTGTIILSGLPTQPTGYLCRMSDQTTAGVVIEETASGTTSVTFTVRALPTGTIQVAANDVLQYECSGY